MNTVTVHHYIGRQPRGRSMRYDTFGRRLRLLRDDLRMSQLELRDKLGEMGVEIGQSYISQLENSDKMPMLEVAAAMANVLGTTVDYLALRTDDPEPPSGQPVYITPEADELARLVDTLPADAREELLRIARRLARPVAGRAEREREIMWWLTRVEAAAGLAARQALERAIMNGDFPSND